MVVVDLDVFHVSLARADQMMHNFVQWNVYRYDFFFFLLYEVKDDMLLLFGWLIDEMVAHCLFSSMVIASKLWSTKIHLILLTSGVTVVFSLNWFFGRYFVPCVYTPRSFSVLKKLFVKE